MIRTSALIVLGVTFAFGAMASQPVATVTSASMFELDGALVNSAGVTAWPLMAGDDVVARDEALTIALLDGSRITLGANSHLHLGPNGAVVSAHLMSGSMHFSIAAGSSLQLFNAQTRVAGRFGSASADSGSVNGPSALFVTRPKAPNPVSVR